MDSLYTKAHIRESLDPQPSTPEQDMQWLAGASADVMSQVRASISSRRVPAAVLIPLVERDTGLTVLLTQRSETLKDHAGQISFPGGRIEPGDRDERDAALREAEEEIGLSPTAVRLIGRLDTYVTRTGFRVEPLVGLLTPPLSLRPDPHEVAEIFEVSLDFLVDPANRRRDSHIFEGSERFFWAIPHEGRYIWGATAGMLINLAEVLGAPAHAGTA
jgi:8-oxo-dGTP pyrophosphatase MutT (NUDIX family)